MVEDVRESASPEVWSHNRRPDAVDNSYRVAGMIHPDQQLIGKEFGNRWLTAPQKVFHDMKWEPPGDFIPFPEDATFSFLGKDIRGGVRKRWPFLERIVRGAEHAYMWMIRNRPDGLVIWTDLYPEHRGAIIAARELRIPVIEMIHGQTHPIRPGALEASSWSDWKLGTQSYRTWAKWYNLPGKVLLTGSPSHDFYSGANLPALRPVARHELNIPEHAPVVCFLTDVPYNRSAWSDEKRTSGTVIEFLKTFRILQTIVEDVHLIVKLHPGEKAQPEHFDPVITKLGIDHNYTIMTDPLASALGASDLVVGIRTSAFADALMLEVPIVCLGYEPFFEEWVFLDKGVKVVRRPEDLLEVLTELLLGTANMGRLLEGTTNGAWYFAGAVDAGATRRTVQSIDRIIRKEPLDGCEHTAIADPVPGI